MELKDPSKETESKNLRVYFLFSEMGYLGGGFKHFLFSPLPGEMIQFD